MEKGNRISVTTAAMEVSMFKYEGISCPHCGEKFKPTDEILICPDCGAPYHRRCIEELGACKFQDLHAKGESWQPPQKAPHEEEETKYDSRAPLRCSRCGTVNSRDKLFCEVCGTPLNREGPESGAPGSRNQPGADWQRPPHQMAYNPYTTPFGGLSPDEEIEEIPVKDLALFVGQNTHYFLPKFKDMATKGKKVSWNWAAFLFDCFYLFYRKMWGPAIVTAVLKLALSVPSLVLFYNMFFLQMGLDMPSGEGTLTLMYQLSNIFYILSLVMRAAISLFTNYLYQRQVFYSVGKLRDRKDSPEYSTLLTAKGGTSVKAVVLCIVATLLFSFLSSIMLLASISSLY